MSDFDKTAPEDTRVLYNAECPICRFEINHYAAYADRKNLPLRFDDLNSDELTRWRLSADQAARRLYVWQNGQMLSGVPAFLALWQTMPRFRWLARIIGLPGLRQASGWVYDHAVAPLLYRRHLRRQARRKALS